MRSHCSSSPCPPSTPPTQVPRPPLGFWSRGDHSWIQDGKPRSRQGRARWGANTKSEAKMGMRMGVCDSLAPDTPPPPHPCNISNPAKIRVVYLLIIEKHQQLSPSSHHFPHMPRFAVEAEGLGAWPAGNPSPPPSPPALLKDFVLLQQSGRTYQRNTQLDRTSSRLLTSCYRLFISHVWRSSLGSSTLLGSHPADVPKTQSAPGVPLNQYR